ncbi:hypothetical protein NDN08_005202 [Rhodosorus marinus]|uniref:Kinetochore protein NDC80 n=1 Tax=Rhodosorus marinus TaxID=101924 RepID=A0AAV8V0U3_9RHOD|nr:hypothetical protein NDN08_005202 [Rhodosorus marinus]
MATRRTTLGPVSNSAMNSRVSIGWGGAKGMQGSTMKGRRASAAPAPLTNSGRRSSTMNGSIRRSSQMVSRTGQAQLTDPRHLQDKSSMASSVRNLICYLSEHGFDHAISPKLLSNPTSKDFQHILIFLLRQIDPSYSFQTRLEDDVRAVYKQLGYPFPISKSSLHAVGSPHTWPALLGALTWLLELLTYDEAASNKQLESEELDAEAQGNRIFFDYLERTYDSFLGGDDNFEELDQELAESFEVKNQLVREEIESFEEENARLEEQVAKIRVSESPLVALRAREKDLEANLDKFRKLIEELENYRMKTTARVQEKKEEVLSREKDLTQNDADIEKLKVTIAQQESDAVDVQRIERDRSALRSATDRLGEQRGQVESAQLEAENTVVNWTQRVESSLSQYRELADKLKIVPATAENANGVTFTANLTRNASAVRPEDLLSVDMKNVVRPALLELKEAFIKSIFETQEEALALQDKIDVLEEKVMVNKDESQLLETRLGKLEGQYKSEKEVLAELLKSSAEESMRVEEDIGSIKRNYEEQLRSSQRRVASATSDLRDFREHLTQLRAEAASNLLNAIDKLTNHKAHIQQSLAALKAHFEQTSASL